MGDPKRLRRKYETPIHPWQKTRIELEKQLQKEYGLKNKKEIWKAESRLKKFKDILKRLIPLNDEQANKEREQTMQKIRSLGLIGENATIDDVLGLEVRSILDRRLQTIVYKKGLARSIKQARQFITHGHIMVNGKVITSPGYLVKIDEEQFIEFKPTSPLARIDHPERIRKEVVQDEQGAA
ncbi:30S ribosomal protein S4 [Candidatus Woesearchaeota archaeon]|nr:30S ribosomal protein S4 [Candidatus Woesearchaeota archaeon]